MIVVTIVTLANTQLTQHEIGKFSRKKGKIRTSSHTERYHKINYYSKQSNNVHYKLFVAVLYIPIIKYLFEIHKCILYVTHNKVL